MKELLRKDAPQMARSFKTSAAPKYHYVSLRVVIQGLCYGIRNAHKGLRGRAGFLGSFAVLNKGRGARAG